MRERKIFIKELETGMTIETQFVVVEKTKEKAKTGRVYVTVKLADKTGRISGKIWDDAENKYALFEKGDVVLVKGVTSTYKGVLEIHIDSIKKCSAGEFDASDFLPVTDKDRKEMFKKLMNMVDSIENSYLKTLLKNIFSDEKIKNGMMNAPASVNVHHAYVGGLLEHTLNVAHVCKVISELYPSIDSDLVISGALLHDIGKIREYEFSGVIRQTNEGKLIGHIALGMSFVQEMIEKIPDFPEELAVSLLHLIISHHGEYEFGSPKLPQTAEAATLAYADLLDSKVESFIEITNNSDEEWSKYVSFLNRRVYTGKKDK
jgi:3'-5' exoribonuclease